MRVTTISLALLAAACARGTSAADQRAADSVVKAAQQMPAAPAAGAPGTVTAEVRDTTDTSLGLLTLTEAADGITVRGRLQKLPPGVHGIHLHATGQCVPPQFTSAGGHWNPDQKKHGTENPAGPHRGDLQNISVGADSTATVLLHSPGGALSALLDADGAAVVVHAGPDDYKTDPSGGSGARIACGVVRRL